MRAGRRRRLYPAIIAAAFALAALGGACAESQQDAQESRSVGDGFGDGGAVTKDGSGDENQGLATDARPDVVTECFSGETLKGPGPVPRICLPKTDGECDGQHDFGLGYPPNGTSGNGFDDDCDGLVDEGCDCPSAGATKDCFLVPAVQTYGQEPVGWCKTNSRGTMACGGGEFPKWTGVCRGAQLPYADDVCAKGDFNCDGRDLNSETEDCACNDAPVLCPGDALETKPFPDPTNLPLKVDGATWFRDAADAPLAANWKWTVRGGDCDNVLPHPTFGIYATPNATGNPIGEQVNTLGAGNERGMQVAAPAISSFVYPAFSLSGDYTVTGEFDLKGRHYSCNQKVKARAAGIRAEACWDTAGTTDFDLHVAVANRLPYALCEHKSWSDASCLGQDCNFVNCKNSLSWYPDSPGSACNGWGSKTKADHCTNPRLDQDLINASCSSNPNGSSFCGSENINIDNPQDGDVFAVELAHFGGELGGRAHINLYCNGERVLSSGYDPAASPPVLYPRLIDFGGSTNGDIWKMGLIAAHVVGGELSCEVMATRSATAYAPTEGPTSAPAGPGAFCVDNMERDGDYAGKYLSPLGIAPHTAQDLCFH